MQRRLAAILASDIVGFSRMIGTDEVGTLTRLKALRADVIDPLLADRGGRIVKETGDGLLVEFGSVVEAVLCAREFQKRVAEQADDGEPIRFRIGINLGDVVVDGDDLFGDGVNIAARLETMAEPGGICLSRSAFDHVKNKVDTTFESMGAHTLKNIAEPVEVFRVATSHRSAVDKVDVQTGRAAKPSIAVRQIENISDNAQLNALAAGLSEDLVTALAETSELSVAPRIDRNIGGQQPPARQPDVDCMLEGRVQGSAKRVRVTLQLTDVHSGNFIWAERYDSDVVDILALQDEIVRKALIELRTRLISGDHARIAGSGTANLNAFLICTEAFEEWAKMGRDNNYRAQNLFRKAQDVDPNWARPLAGLAATFRESAIRGWGLSRERDLAEAVSYAKRALVIDPQDPAAHTYLGLTAIDQGDLEHGLALCAKAVDLAPNNFAALGLYAWALPRSGDLKLSLAMFARSRKVRPIPSGAMLMNEAFVTHLAGQRERAIEVLSDSLERIDTIDLRVRLAAVYADFGQMKKARAEIENVLERQPDATIREYIDNLPFPDEQRKEWYRELLLSAGLPDGT